MINITSYNIEIRTKKDFERHYYALKNVLGSLQLMTYLEQKQIEQIFVCQKKKYFASILIMASYNRHSNNLDKDLDSLSFSYLDGIPFRLDPRIEAVNNYDFTRVDTLLAQTLPTPGLSDMCENLIQKMGEK